MEQNPYESPNSAPERSRATTIILAIGVCLLFVLFVIWARGIPKSWVFSYDQAAYRGISKRLTTNFTIRDVLWLT
jgi:hypothetical protein